MIRNSENTIILLILLTILSCSDNQKTASKNFPTLIDTFEIKTDKYNQDKFGVSSSTILYLGKRNDSITINYDLKEFTNPPPPPPFPDENPENFKRDSIEFQKTFDQYIENRRNHPLINHYVLYENSRNTFTHPAESDIKITIDTTQIIKHDASELQWDKYYSGYPIVIENKSSDTIIIGYESYIPIILEAKNNEGEWLPIEKNYIFKCGNGMRSLLFPPNQILISSKPIYKGEFKTDLRVRFGENYSNSIKAKINLSQFDKPNY